MRLYLAAYAHDSAAPQPPRVLLSYYYVRGARATEYFSRALASGLDVFLDSGAFSAKTLGESIRREDYSVFLRRWGARVTVYANLDDLSSAESTRKNQEFLEAEGHHPLPVHHFGEPMSVFEDLCARYDYVAVGGVARQPRPTRLKHAEACFRVAGRTRLHGFGVSDFEVLRAFPWYSADSSSWAVGMRFGNTSFFDPRRGSFVGRFDATNLKNLLKHRDLLSEVYGVSPREIVRENAGSAKTLSLMVRSWMMVEEWLTERERRVFGDAVTW